MSRPSAASNQMLVVDADEWSRTFIQRQLTSAGYAADGVGSGQAALARIRDERFSALVIDLLTPDVDGTTLCRAARAAGPNTRIPILMIASRDTEADRILSLDSGADDCLAKPVATGELLARVAAVMRRQRLNTSSGHAEAAVQTREVTIDLDGREVTVRGEHVSLTRHEFDVLALLAGRRGIVFSRAALLASVWPDRPDVSARTVDVVISRIRRKIERDADAPRLLLTSWGVGYKFVDLP